MKLFLNHPSASRRGMTLIELAITSAMMVVIIGLALGMMTQTQKAAKLVNERLAVTGDCQRILAQTSDMIRHGIRPENLNGFSEPVELQWSAERLQMATLEQGTSVSLCLLSIGQKPGDGEQDEPIIAHYTPLGGVGSSGAVIARERETTFPGGSEGYRYHLSFAFAAAAAPGQPVDYQKHWETGTPDLVRLRLVAEPKEEGDPVTFQTAVIPGYSNAVPRAVPAVTVDEVATSATLVSGGGR